MEIDKYSPKWLLTEIRNAESDAHALFKIIEFQKAVTEQCNIANVVGRSEQLVCDCAIPKPKDAYDEPDKYYCRDCNGRIAN